MNLLQFKILRQGKRFQENSNLWYQCVSLIKLYLESCFWYPRKKAGNANEVWVGAYSYMPNDWTKERNKKSIISQKPMVWAVLITDNLEDKNPYGHIWIVTDSWDWKTFTMLQQNWMHGSWLGINGDEICEKQYDYNYVLGWYNPPVEITKDIPLDQEAQIAKDKWIWNWERGNEFATRQEVSIMINRALK